MKQESHLGHFRSKHLCANTPPNLGLAVQGGVVSRWNPNWILGFKGFVMRKMLMKWEGKFWGTTMVIWYYWELFKTNILQRLFSTTVVINIAHLIYNNYHCCSNQHTYNHTLGRATIIICVLQPLLYVFSIIV